MPQRLQRKRFRPQWAPTLATLILLPGLVWLGLWQLDRAAQKRVVWTAFEARSGEPKDAAEIADARAHLYRPVFGRGRFQPDRQFLIDNIVQDGRNGFYVLTPFELRGSGTLLLVNRGWVPQDPARQVLPGIDADTTAIEIAGIVGKLPVAGIRLGKNEPAADGWPSIRQFPDFAELETALETTLPRWVLLLNDDAPGGFSRRWKPAGVGPDRHLGYAVQWFGLALTLVAIFVVMSRRTPRKKT